MKNLTKLSDFKFELSGYGHYRVIYTSPVTGKTWTKNINNMPLVDATKNEEDPKQTNLNQLKRVCKSQ